jgi:hypothetical protein
VVHSGVRRWRVVRGRQQGEVCRSGTEARSSQDKVHAAGQPYRTLTRQLNSRRQLEAAIAGFEVQKNNIDAEIAELRAILTGSSETVADQAPAKRKGRKVSAAAIKRMSEAQKLRRAKIKANSQAAPKSKATNPAKTARAKPHFSAAARKALSEAMKKRWAAKKRRADSPRRRRRRLRTRRRHSPLFRCEAQTAA